MKRLKNIIIPCLLIITALTCSLTAYKFYWRKPLPPTYQYQGYYLIKEKSHTPPQVVVQKITNYQLHSGTLLKRIQSKKILFLKKQTRFTLKQQREYALEVRQEAEFKRALTKIDKLGSAKTERVKKDAQKVITQVSHILRIEEERVRRIFRKLVEKTHNPHYARQKLQVFLNKHEIPMETFRRIGFKPYTTRELAALRAGPPMSPREREEIKRWTKTWFTAGLITLITFFVFLMFAGEKAFVYFSANKPDAIKLLCFPIYLPVAIILWNRDPEERYIERCQSNFQYVSRFATQQLIKAINNRHTQRMAFFTRKAVAFCLNAMPVFISSSICGSPAHAQTKKTSTTRKSNKRKSSSTPTLGTALFLGNYNNNGLSGVVRTQIRVGKLTKANIGIETMALVGTDIFFPGIGLSVSPWKWLHIALLAQTRTIMSGEWSIGYDFELRLKTVFSILWFKAWALNYIWLNALDNYIGGLHLWRIRPIPNIPLWIGFHGEWTSNWSNSQKSSLVAGLFVGIKRAGITITCNTAQPINKGCSFLAEYLAFLW